MGRHLTTAQALAPAATAELIPIGPALPWFSSRAGLKRRSGFCGSEVGCRNATFVMERVR